MKLFQEYSIDEGSSMRFEPHNMVPVVFDADDFLAVPYPTVPDEYTLIGETNYAYIQDQGVIEGWFVGAAEYVIDYSCTPEEGPAYETNYALAFRDINGQMLVLKPNDGFGYKRITDYPMVEYHWAFYPIDFPAELKGCKRINAIPVPEATPGFEDVTDDLPF